MKSISNTQSAGDTRQEWFWVGLLLSVFALINLTVATHTPVVSSDEPGYTDPAANLYLGSGFTSTMWGQGSHEFWCGNVPLFQGILYVGFKLFGFGLFQARAVNLVLAGGGVFLIWAGLSFSRIIGTRAGRILCVALMLSGAVTTLTFRTVRPDATMFFVCALVFFCSQLPFQMRYRCLLAGLAATLLPVAGMPMLPYIGTMTLIGVICLGWTAAGLLVSVCVGIGCGIGLLAVFYNYFSSFKTFLAIVLPFTVLGGQHDGSGPGRWHAKVFGEYPGSDNLLTCFFGNPISFIDQKTICDYSAALLFMLFLVMAAQVWRTADQLVRRRIVFVVLLTLIVPPAMHMAGHYRSMYRWMTYIPLTIATPWILGLKPELLKYRPLSWLTASAIASALIMGIPARTLIIIPTWSARSITPIDHVVTDLVHPDDVVICNRQSWFAVRPHAGQVYCCDLPAVGEFSRTVVLPTNSVTLLCLCAKDYAPVTQAIGGRWQKIQAAECPDLTALSKTRYDVDFYRRIAK
jgi:hypothetical protein